MALKAYAERREAEGHSSMDILRCLKRFIARDVSHCRWASYPDVQRPAEARRPDPTGSPPIRPPQSNNGVQTNGRRI